MAGLDYLDYALHDNRIVGVKVEQAGTWYTAICKDRGSIANIMNRYNGKGGVYITLNRLNPETKPMPLGQVSGVLRNEDFTYVTRLFFDFDASKKPASEEEIIELAKVKNELVRYLDLKGFDAPAIGFSGNGWHVIYRVRIERTEYEAFKDDLYFGLKEQFPQGFDVSVRNPGRVSRLYGTINTKCQREATCRLPPTGWRIVPKEIVLGAVKRRPKRIRTVNGADASGILELFEANGMVISRRREKEGIYQVVCPWENEHTENKRGGTYVLTNRGYEVFYCHHNHCQHRRNRHVLEFFRASPPRLPA